MEWKWSYGEPYPKSIRKQQIQPVVKNTNNHENNNTTNEISYETYGKEEESYGAYSASLFHDENTWDILNQSIYQENFRQSNRREDLDDKMANRELIQQIGYNPFLNQTNYADDISIHDQYLKPQNSSKEETLQEK
jgi:hypothetical protein